MCRVRELSTRAWRAYTRALACSSERALVLEPSPSRVEREGLASSVRLAGGFRVSRTVHVEVCVCVCCVGLAGQVSVLLYLCMCMFFLVTAATDMHSYNMCCNAVKTKVQNPRCNS